MSWNSNPPNSYYPPPSGPPPNQYGGYPPQQPQQQYGAPPYGAPPPQPQQGWGAPPPQQGYGLNAPQSYGAPPSPQPYGVPPYGGPPPQAPYGAPPHQQYGVPPQQGYGNAPARPQDGYQPPPGPPPQQQAAYGMPPQAPYGAPPMQQQSRPSPGYDVNFVANVDTSHDAEAVRGAMKGFGTNEAQLIQVLTRISDPYVMASLRKTYEQRFRRNLMKDLDDETNGYFQETLQALARGPLAQDVHNLNDAIKGAGTKENVLNDVLLGRSNADINAIKQEYQRVYRRSLEADVKGDLSMKTEQLFTMILGAHRADESAPVIPQKLDTDVRELHRATEGTKMGTDQIAVCHIFNSNSDGQLRAISQEFQKRYAQPLSKVIEREFSGHMEVALLRMLHVAEDRAMADAVSLEDTMKGSGTKDRLLLNRLVRIHWNKDHVRQVKAAYQHRYKKDLSGRVRGETSGDFRKILLALVD